MDVIPAAEILKFLLSNADSDIIHGAIIANFISHLSVIYIQINRFCYDELLQLL